MSEFFWEIITKDGEVIDISPAGAPIIQKRLTNKDPINLKNQTIPFSEIKAFRETTKPYGIPLLEGVAQAFRAPEFNENGEIAARWVKQRIPYREWAKHYSLVPGYKQLESDGSSVMIAFRKAMHEVNTAVTPYCTDQEIDMLTRT